MILAVALAAVAPTAGDPGVGTRLSTELGVGTYGASFEASRAAGAGKTGIDGIGVRVRSTVGYPVRPGFVLGPSIGVEYTWLQSSGGLCCSRFRQGTGGRVGVEASIYPSPQVGFRINGGFGVVLASLSRPASDGESDLPVGAVELVKDSTGIGSYFTLAVARDWAVGAHSRIGGVLRIEADSIVGRDDRRYHWHAFTPSLAVVLVNGL